MTHAVLWKVVAFRNAAERYAAHSKPTRKQRLMARKSGLITGNTTLKSASYALCENLAH